MLIETTTANRRALKPNEWCKKWGSSRSTLYRLWKEGKGPDYIVIAGRRRIPPEADDAWATKNMVRSGVVEASR